MSLFPKREQFDLSPRFAQRVLTYGLGLGVLGSILFFDVERPGLPLALWLTGFAMAAGALSLRFRPEKLTVVLTWSIVAVAAAAMLSLRLNPVTLLSMLVIVLLAAAVVIMALRGISLRDTSILQFATACLRLPLQALTGSFALIGKTNLRSNVRDPALLSVLRGLLIALPLALLFGALFSSADASFARVFDSFLQFFGPDMPEHILLALCFGWLGAGLLVSISSIEIAPENSEAGFFRLGEIETTVVMSILLALFALFVLIQLPYLFGGKETIEATSGLTLANYARRGFFELVWVMAIALSVLIAFSGAATNRKRFKPLATGMVGCLFLIMISASQRLFLYMDGFGLTLARLSAAVIMVWLALCLILFAISLLRDSDRGFIPGALYSGLFIAFTLSLLSPPRVVANYNIEHAQRTDTLLDVSYLSTLGDEVVPVLLENFALLDAGQRCLLTWQWTEEFDLQNSMGAEPGDWRSWNLAHSRAVRELQKHKEDLPTLVSLNRSQLPLPGLLPMGMACASGGTDAIQ